MNVSIVIPVYNAAPYVQQAVDSALQQPETGEIILVEDGSPDRSLEACRAIAASNPSIRLITHPGNRNMGASASRNAGIDAATLPYLAFLDADDFYLPNRFARTRQLFSENPHADAVFEAIGTHFEDEAARRQYERIGGPLITGMKTSVPPERVFEAMGPIGSGGHCHLDGLVVRAASLPRDLRFDPALPIIGDDTVFFLKLAAALNIIIGDINRPIAQRRVHEVNHITRSRSHDQAWDIEQRLWLSVYRWLSLDPAQSRRRQILVSKMLWKAGHTCLPADAGPFSRRCTYLGRIARLIAAQPQLLRENRFLVTAAKQAR